ncbi:23S rRNA (uracil(1939)-C(5))-methyltransferase RlmD [Pseudohongiella sp.]|uniref:TRAM domain-containing protein n=1 Tax=marine sediment metagenome TaxID=412755 RepID=A0A0F9YEI0_9ZZZZ|nr:23S rRNA (uracil(1939)-C(5))-methyltransferase RlmD [Pseudohongiella sp.]HDZ09854.1 23S rRNA (uracil(1939)-C(5))-methyltransferase RlmD [Pseudohongiella sp.]HEA61531.1 23S rRNA (uracil(1939)-C(5))-methyltransferase RlmD [Pseudohongiella sp.]
MTKSRRRRQKLPAEAVSVTIERLSHEGRGVGKIDGKIVFVDGALPGEEVTAVYRAQRSQYDELKVQDIVTPSAQRVQPPCAVAAICGGCVLQHLAPSGQLDLKQQVLADQLKHTGGISDFAVLPAMTGDTEFYRRKARLAVRYVHKKADVLVGFREAANTFITDMHHCSVLVKPVADLISPLRALILSLDACRDIPQIEVAVGETHCVATEQMSEVLRVALVLRHLAPLADADLKRLQEFADTHGIEWFLQSGGPDTVKKFWPADDNTSLYYFLPQPADRSGAPQSPITIEFRPGDFTQVNAAINRQMIDQALDLLDLQAEDNVLDLFCGLGNFTLAIALRCNSVTGVEGGQDMVTRATRNAERNNIANASFYAADLFTDFDSSTWAKPGYNKLLLDPPRSGAIEIVTRIRELLPQKIVYVSCNPATLARDSAELQRQGYELVSAGVMDMFPHTGHVESMALFTLKT